MKLTQYKLKIMHKFGKVSTDRLATCHKDLQIIMLTAIALSDVDFGIAEGYRSLELQQKYFKEGKSRIDGITRKGKHNYQPALAVDFYPWVNGKMDYHLETVSHLAGFIMGIAALLLQQGKISHELRWGANWDMDGQIIQDETFVDRPHLELVNPRP